MIRDLCALAVMATFILSFMTWTPLIAAALVLP